VTRILGQPPIPNPPEGFGSWEQYKLFWFERYDYKVYAQEVLDFHMSTAPTRIVSAPARTSKSFSTAMDTIPFCMPSAPLTSSQHWIIGPTYDTNKEFDYVFNCLVEQKDRHLSTVTKARNNPKNGDMVIVLEHGRDDKGELCRSIIEGKSATNERALQGEEVTTATLSEAAEHPSHIFTKYLMTRCWKINLPTTPKPYAEWILKMIEEADQDPTVGIDAFTFPVHANPDYSHERYERARKRAEKNARVLLGPNATARDDPHFAEQFLGEWVYYTGRVLPFDPKRHMIDRAALGDLSNNKNFISCDYGFSDAAVALFWTVLPNGILVIFDEIYERELTTPKFVQAVQDKMDASGAEFAHIVGDPSKPEVARIMRDCGLRVWDYDKNAMRDRAAGKRRVVDALAEGPEPGFPGLYLTHECEKTAAEWRHLRYKKNARDEDAASAMAGDDHAYDACRYGIMTRPTPRAEEKEEDFMAQYRRRLKARQAGRGWSTPRWARALTGGTAA
jgi:hypothetical protein